jgi:nodulation protein E
MTRIVVTGIGVRSCVGNNLRETWEAVSTGTLGFRQEMLGRDGETGPIGRIDKYTDVFCPQKAPESLIDPVTRLALAATSDAMSEAGLNPVTIDPTRIGCVLGTGAGSEHSHDFASRLFHGEGRSRSHPLTVPRIMISSLPSLISIEFGFKGPVFAISSACASGAQAIEQATLILKAGVADIVIAGGSEACLTEACVTAWRSMHILARDTCRPFSLGRTGLVLADGAASLVLETFENAQARGAPILAEIAGIGSASDAGSITSPDVDGMTRAMRLAIANAGLLPEHIDTVNAHGTGTEINDRTESAALMQVFGDRLAEVPVSATKSVTGHALGAAPAIELAMSIMTIKFQFIPPTASFLAADPLCPVDCVPGRGRQMKVLHVLSNAFAFGGLNTSIVVRHADAC